MGDPSNSAISNPGSLGGGDKKPGATGKNTFQISNTRQIVVIARYEPAPTPFTAAGMSTADSLIGSVTGAVQKGVDAAESAMAMIPGLQMFIKEDKKESTSQKEYKYEYKDWDSKKPELDSNLKKLYPDNKVLDFFKFSAADADGIKQAAQDYYNATLKSSLSTLSNYPVWIHLIGIGQGGNAMNEIGNLLANDSQFMSEDWKVKSIFYIGTPFYADSYQLNESCLKSEGELFNFNCSLDLTQQVIPYFTPTDDFVKFIQNSNSNTMSLAVGKIKLTIIKILSLFLGNSTISFSDPHGLDKFGEIKPEIEKLIDQMTGMIKQIVSEITSFIDPGKLPDFSAALNGLSDVPGQSVKRFTKFLSDLGDAMESQARNMFGGTGSLGPQNLMGVFNCLCPLLDQITKMLSILEYDSPATIALANQMIETAGITDLHRKADSKGNSISLDNTIALDYMQERSDNFQKAGKIDKINQLISDATALFADLDKGAAVKVTDLSDDQKMQLAGAIYSIVQPMLLSKKRVLEELQKWIAKLDISAALKDLTANKLLDFAGKAFGGLNLAFEQPLKDSINNVDGQLNRLKSYLEPHEYQLYKDTLYFVYDVHNKVINTFHPDVQTYLNKQTGYDENMFKDAPDAMPVNKVPEPAAT